MVSLSLPLAALAAFSALVGEPTPKPQPTISVESHGDIYMARKMYREAIDTYQQLPEDSAVRWNKIGIAYHQLMDLNTAKRNYERAVQINPRYAEAINNLGTVYYAQKSYRRSVREYKKALRIEPESASVYSNLGTSYFARKDYKHAMEAYGIALKIDPDVFDHKNSFGVFLQERSVTDRARYHYFMAKNYAQAGMTERALQCMRKALEEGFEERKRFMEDPEFAKLRSNQEFQEILHSDPRVL